MPMIRKLKLKFVAINMLLVTVIIASLFYVILRTNSKTMENESINDLNKIISMTLIDLARATNQNNSQSRKIQFTPLFIVNVDDDLKITSQIKSNVSIDDESLNEALSYALNDRDNMGVIKKMELRYLKVKTDYGYRIAFIDISRENQILDSLILILLVTGGLAELLFFLISLFLSSWALKPVETNWIKQKQFIADASHELKTPITVLLANMDILEQNQDDSIKNQIKWINSSKHEANQMKHLIEEMLFLAKSDANANKINISRVNVSDVLIMEILSLEAIAFEKQIVIDYDSVEDDLYTNADEKQLKTVFSILLENACKYGDVNTTITVRLKRDGDKIRFEVNNFGPVIDRDEIDHIFERFYRIEKSRSKDSGGYGLGLSIAKKIIDSNHMKISATSSKQDGTSFKIVMSLA